MYIPILIYIYAARRSIVKNFLLLLPLNELFFLISLKYNRNLDLVPSNRLLKVILPNTHLHSSLSIPPEQVISARQPATMTLLWVQYLVFDGLCFIYFFLLVYNNYSTTMPPLPCTNSARRITSAITASKRMSHVDKDREDREKVHKSIVSKKPTNDTVISRLRH